MPTLARCRCSGEFGLRDCPHISEIFEEVRERVGAVTLRTDVPIASCRDGPKTTSYGPELPADIPVVQALGSSEGRFNVARECAMTNGEL